MGPLGFLTGVILGSAASLASILLMVLVIFAFLSGDHPRLESEYGGLTRAAVVFAGLTAVAGVAFEALQRRRPWRWYAQAALWAALAGVVLAYWPTPAA